MRSSFLTFRTITRFFTVLAVSWPLFSPADAEIRQPVFLSVAGEVDPALVERGRQWAVENLAIPVPRAPDVPLEGPVESLDRVAEAAAPLIPGDSLGWVVLYGADTKIATHGIYRPDLKVVVVNVKPLLEGGDAEKIGRRIERQVIRGICLLMGMDYSPNPESAMTYYGSLEELDAIGRNLDPPWLMKLQERAREWGIPLDPESPYNLFREPPEE